MAISKAVRLTALLMATPVRVGTTMSGSELSAQTGRARSHPDPDVHYEWLALRLCRGHKYEEIANDYCSQRGEQLTGEGVRQAVRRKADLIGLKVPSRT